MVPKKYVHASIFPFFFLSTNNQYRYVFVRYQKMLSNILTNILSGFTRRFEMLPYFHIWEWERKQELKDELKALKLNYSFDGVITGTWNKGRNSFFGNFPSNSLFSD